MQEVRDCYVYSHFRQDKLEIFNIGIGNQSNYARAYSKSGRNRHWHNIVKLNPNYLIDILYADITWKEACKKEVELISKIGRSDLKLGSLVNLTNGGEGSYGRHLSKESLSKMRLTKSTNGFRHTQETRNKMSKQRKGISNKKLIGHKMPDSTRKAIRKSLLGKVYNNKEVINTKTGEIFKSANIAASSISMNPFTLRAMLRGNNPNKTDMEYLSSKEEMLKICNKEVKRN